MTSKEIKREQRLARRRTRFRYVTDGLPLYERPCGCTTRNYLPEGVRMYQHSVLGGTFHPHDVVECLQCKAVWAVNEKPWIGCDAVDFFTAK